MRALVLLLLCLGLGPGCDLRGIRPSFALRGPVPAPEDPAELGAALFQATGARLLPGHRWSLAANGTVFSELARDIEGARVSVNIEEYIWEPGRASDELLAALSARVRGVRCRVLADPVGSPDFERKIAPRLRAAGCEARLFRPLTTSNLLERNHRKAAIIDGRVAYLGGFGVRDEWLSRKRRRRFLAGRRAKLRMIGEWRDDNIRVTGPAVSDVQRAFAQNWIEAGGALLRAAELPPIAPDGPARVAFVSSTAGYVTDGERLLHLLIRSARRRLHIANAYFVPDASLLQLLCEKAREGVDVRVLAPGSKNDIPIAGIGQRRLYKELLGAGIQVYEYQPAMMHAKTMVIDDRLVVIGSLNLNLLSLSRLEEAVFVIDDPELAAALGRSWQDDLGESKQVRRR